VKRRIVQRAPNLGLTLRLQPVGGAVTADCAPEVGPARWFDYATGDYTAPIAYGGCSFGDWHEPTGQIFWVGKVTGALCGAAVSWDVTWDSQVDYMVPAWIANGETLSVCSVAVPNGPTFGQYRANTVPGILTATPTVHLAAGAQQLAPLVLITVLYWY
jgi:hypothetical protein